MARQLVRPSVANTCSRRVTCPRVSSRCDSNAFRKPGDIAAFAIFGRAFVSCFPRRTRRGVHQGRRRAVLQSRPLFNFHFSVRQSSVEGQVFDVWRPAYPDGSEASDPPALGGPLARAAPKRPRAAPAGSARSNQRGSHRMPRGRNPAARRLDGSDRRAHAEAPASADTEGRERRCNRWFATVRAGNPG
jgi:hypothetical protein